ncbi:MAG: hypothetical protein JNK18_04870 [Cyclobacteriaceae bacterium]|nr:hypothetical protein [Cyclobacteriaceae bacterium]
MRKFITFLLLAAASIPVAGNGFLPPPSMSGPSTVAAGTSNTYSVTATGVIAPVWNISSGTATINSTWTSGNTYYASVTWTTSGTVQFLDEVSGGVSISKSVTAITTPVTVPATTCGPGTVTLSATPGSGGDKVRWYTVASGGTYFSEAATYTTGTISTSVTYYVETWSTSASMAGPRVAIVAGYGAVPGAPASVTPASLCGSGPLTLSATAGTNANTIRWFSSPVGGDTVRTGLSLTTPSLRSPVMYYAASYNSTSGCLSTRTPVLANANPKPADLMAWSAESAYGSGTVTLRGLMSTGYAQEGFYSYQQFGDLDTAHYEVRWYATKANADANTGSLKTGIPFTTPEISTSTIYYVRVKDKASNCYSDVGQGTAVVVPYISQASVQTDVIRVTGKKTDASLNSLTDAEKTTSVSYLDGIGRTQQQVIVRGSTDGKDIVSPVEYDSWGRASKSYLPYKATSTDGSLHSGYKVEQKSFYLNTSDKVADDSAAYAVTVYDTSPLGRVVEQGGVGKGYQPGQSHTSKVEYLFNTSGDQVRKFYANGGSTGYYPANALSKMKSISADGNHTLTFTDGSGNTVLVRQQLAATVEGVYTDYLETYYVYNDLGQVNFIISPKGVAELKANSWAFNSTIKDGYCNQFRYDNKGRVIEKKVPGQAWQYIIYDPLGRIVLTQDGMLRPDNKWMFIKYDFKGNAVMTGLHTNTTYTTRATLQTYVDGLYVVGHATFGDDKWYEYQGTTLEGYTNVSFPSSNLEVLAVNYFDDYDFDNASGADVSYVSAGLTGEHTPATYSLGRATGSKRKILGTSTWLKSYVFYDDRGRTIQVQTTNSLNTSNVDRITNAYADDGRLLFSKKHHNNGAYVILNKYEYTTRGQLWKLYQDNAGTGSAYQLVAQYEYNELGQLVDKKLHNTGGSNFLQSVDYRYTIRGQLKSINNSELSSNSSNDETNDYFGMELLYHETESGLTTSARYDGNISAMKWKTMGSASGPAGQRSYAYTYDKTGKLTTAAYRAKESSWDKESGAQDETLTYDHNGNIKTLERKQRKHQLTGLTGSYTNEAIDNLTYAYNSSDANSLQKVTDAASTSAASGFNNGSSSTSNDYTYDANGNLLSDANKGITSIVYNFLGKPTQVNFSDGKKIEYGYDAGGNKLTQKLYQGTTLQTTTHYVNGFVYEAAGAGSPVLSFFGSPEGRVVNNSGTLTYEYSIADHQGNTRVVFTSATIAPEAPVATFEDSGGNTNEYVNVVGTYVVSATLANHTPAGSKAVRMNQSYPVGPGKSFKVYPGDKVDPSVWAYFEDASGYGTSSPALAAIMGSVASMFGGVSGGSGESGKIYSGISNAFSATGLAGNLGNSRPAAYLNYILVDKDYKFLTMGWQVIPNTSFTKMEVKFSAPIVASEEGYMYVYLSYENESNNFVYFDDFKVSLQRSNVIQYNEYYPFGLQTSTSWTRENTKDNNYLYNAANELNKTSGWYEMFYRGYDPAIGRMLQVDPYAPLYASHTTYNYAVNNPVMMNDPSGGKADVIDRALGSLNRISSRLASTYASYANEWAFSASSYLIDPIFYSAQDYARGGSLFTRTAAERAEAKGEEPPPGSYTFTHEIDGIWYGGIVTYDADGIIDLITAGATHGDGGPLIEKSAIIYDRSTADVWYSVNGTQGGERSDPNRLDRFFDIAGRADVVASSILTSFSKGFETTSEQIARSKYWTQATKSSTSTFAKNLKFAGYAGIVASTFISGYELYLNGGTWGGWARFGVGLAITATGFIPYVGVPIAIGLGAYEAAGGLDGFYKDMDTYQSVHRLFTGGK